jgi:hypothetical protein
MSDFRIEKVRHALEITLATGETLAGTVFLEPRARTHDGPQDLRELLDGDEAFFPVAVDDRVLLVAKDQVRVARYKPDHPPVVPTPPIDVRVTLVDNTTIDGGIEVEAHPDARRLLDHLNAFEGRFLSMITADGASQCLVNRRMIVGVQQR